MVRLQAQARWSPQRRGRAGRTLPWGPWEGARPCDTLAMGSWPQSWEHQSLWFTHSPGPGLCLCRDALHWTVRGLTRPRRQMRGQIPGPGKTVGFEAVMSCPRSSSTQALPTWPLRAFMFWPESPLPQHLACSCLRPATGPSPTPRASPSCVFYPPSPKT